MTKGEFSILLNKIQEEEVRVRADGQAEYCHDDLNAFANFERLALELDLSREMVLWVYLKKHLDGILSWIKGNRSQRESVQGRIKDARMFLALLWGMADEDEKKGTTYRETTLCSCVVRGFVTDSNLPYKKVIAPYGLKGSVANAECKFCHGLGRVVADSMSKEQIEKKDKHWTEENKRRKSESVKPFACLKCGSTALDKIDMFNVQCLTCGAVCGIRSLLIASRGESGMLDRQS